MARIEAGEAEGLVAWHPDRLARNSVDGGRIIYLLDIGRLKDLKFATYTFENTPQGKFMLSIIFANSKYYVDALSENIRRGNRTKVENGWLPGMARIGYLNDKDTKTIVPDPERFALVRQHRIRFHALICLWRPIFQKLLRHGTKIGRGDERALDVAELARSLRFFLRGRSRGLLRFCGRGFLSGCLEGEARLQ